MIYHIVAEAELRSHTDGQRYLPETCATDGFVHCSFEVSVLAVANDYYAGARDTVLLLRIDPDKLSSPVRDEPAAAPPGAAASHLASSPLFPHVYGPIDNAAVDGIGILTRGEHG